MASPLTTYIKWLSIPEDIPFPEECKSLNIKTILNLAEEDLFAGLMMNQLFNDAYAYNYSIEDIARLHKKHNSTYRFNYIKQAPKLPEPVKKEEVKEVVVHKKTKYKRPKEKPGISEEINQEENPMLVNVYYDGDNRQVAYVTRVDRKRYIEIVDDNVMMYYGKDDYLNVSDIARLKSELVSYRYRNKTIEKHREEHPYDAIYNVDLNIAIPKTVSWKENHPNAGTYKLRINYIDIELYQEGYGVIDFSDLKTSARLIPVNLITIYDNYDDKYYTLIYNLNRSEIKPEQIKGYLDYKDECNFDVRIFDKETDLFLEFFRLLKEFDPDLVSGWNSDEFDLPYIKYRAEFLGIKNPKLAHNKVFGIEYKTLTNKHNEEITYCIPKLGYSIALDYQRCYKERAFGKRENYKLGTISQYELGITKLDTEDGMDKIFREEPERFIAYNINDVHLVRKLDEKLKYIDLCFNIIQFSNISWDSVYTTLHIVDGILYEYLIKQSKVMKIVNRDVEKQPFMGAYVRKPISGVHDWLGDLDLTSLYPYIMARYNISADTYVGKLDFEDSKEYIYNKESFINSNKKINLYLRVDGVEKRYEISTKGFHDKMIKNKYIITYTGTIFKRHEDKLSVLYEIIQMLISKRKEYKDLMKDNIGVNDMLVDRYNGMQMTVKVITNSLYGAQSNNRFRMYDYEVARSITTTGREIAKVAAVVANDLINQMIRNKSGKFNSVEIPYDWEEKSDDILSNVVYGDSVTGDSLIRTGIGNIPVKDIWETQMKTYPELSKTGEINTGYVQMNGKEYILNPNMTILGVDDSLYIPRYIMKHKVKKKLYKITTESGKSVTVTEDHSLIVYRDNKKLVIKPTELIDTDKVIVI